MPAERALPALLLALLLAGCADPPPFPLAPAPPGNAATIEVVDLGWHTEISLPADALDARFDALRARFPGARTFTFGFGERAFVLKHERTVLDALRALLPGSGLVLVTALNTTPEAAFGDDAVIPLAVSAAGHAAVIDYVRHSMQDDATGAPIYVGEGPYPGSAFYAATLTYDGLFTCNTWTAEALHAGGVPMTTDAVLLAGQVIEQVRWREAR